MPKKRVLWLFNHCTLIKSEVPILKELGYEVFIPKIPPFDVSIAVDWSEDDNLTIPKDKLDILNRTDFYDSRIPRESMEIMNEYFDTVIFGMFLEPFKSLILNFKGRLIFHPFGISNDMSYTNIILSFGGVWLLRKIEEVGNRFWFGQSYENLYEIECDFLKKRAINLPIGMKDISIKDRWEGSKKKVLFVCPRIKINSYYYSIYKQFKEDFKGFNYSIGGVQPIEVSDDPNVVGYLPDEEYEAFYPSHSCMFYHSQEKRHIHYHPFEAIKCGLPLIFMAGGLLDILGGSNLPGRCKTIKEARKKCKRIIDGDIKFANKVRKSQSILLEAMSYEKCRNKWKESMDIIEDSLVLQRKTPEKKLAVILPEAYQGGVLDYTINLLNIISDGLKQNNEPIKLIYGYPRELENDYSEVFDKLICKGILLRTFEWKTLPLDKVLKYSKLTGQQLIQYENEYSIMDDDICYFDDCDYLLFVVDRVRSNLFITKPYGVIVHDYIQRYIPDIIGDYYEKPFIDLVRNSQANFTTTNCTLEDCVQYAGVRREYINLIPLFFNDIEKVSNKTLKYKKEYFLWSTNIGSHKNHIFLLKALELYYAMGGTLDCYITGVKTELFNQKNLLSNYELIDKQVDYLNKCRNMISNSKSLKKHLHFMGNMPKVEYYDLLKSASFLIHPGYGDNGNGSAVDAALLGVPTLSSDYPAMRNMDNVMNLGITFFDKKKSQALADMLLLIETNLSELKKKLPPIDDLRKHTISNKKLCETIYNVIRANIDI